MNNPVWIDERGKIIEPEYCRDFLSRHPIRCINDRFYTVEGPLPDESKLKRTIYEEISPWLHAKVAQTVEQIIKALKLAAYTDPLPLQCDRIHVANGTCFLDGTFTEEKSIAAIACRYPIGLMLRHRNIGCVSFRNCWSRRIFSLCRNIWATACFPLPRGRKCSC